MNTTKKLLPLLLLLVLCCSCLRNSETVKVQRNRRNIIQVQDKIQEIKIEDVLLNNYSMVHLIDRYLAIKDPSSYDKIIYLFDKNDFSYITSTGDKGPGPYELTTPGDIGFNATNRKLYVPDHGKYQFFFFDLDSVLANPSYTPKERLKFDRSHIPIDMQYLNDTLSIGYFIMPVSNSDFRPAAGIWNMSTDEITLLNTHDHPQIQRKRASFAASLEHGIFVEGYMHHDLMSICDLDGNLKYYIYGGKWDDRTQNKVIFYTKIIFCKDKIVGLYGDGDDNFIQDKDGVRSNEATKLIIFDINGDYIQTMELGYKTLDICYDQDNNRIIMSMDDVIQFAYLDLDGIIIEET